MMAMPDGAAPQAADIAAQHAQAAQQHATAAQNSAQQAQGAAAQAVAAQAAEPSWIYALVIAILGAALIALIVGVVIAALSGRTVDTAIVSAASLITGGLIGVLAPSPQRGK
jgi:type VI protein secretion system component VasF